MYSQVEDFAQNLRVLTFFAVVEHQLGGSWTQVPDRPQKHLIPILSSSVSDGSDLAGQEES